MTELYIRVLLSDKESSAGDDFVHMESTGKDDEMNPDVSALNSNKTPLLRSQNITPDDTLYLMITVTK